MVIHFPGGATATYERESDGSYKTPAGYNNTLVYEANGEWTLTDHASQTKYLFHTYENHGKIKRITDRNGRSLFFEYSPTDGHLDGIESAHTSRHEDPALDDDTDETRFTRAGRLITQMTDPAGRTYGYAYTGENLISYQDPQNGATYKTLYEYNGPNGTLSKITTPQGSVTTIAYYPSGHENFGRVKSVTRVTNTTTMSGPTTSFEYSLRKDGSGYAEVTDPIGSQSTDVNDRITRQEFDDQGRVTKTTDALGRETSRKLTTNGNVESYTAAGNAGTTPNTKFTYDGDDNLTETSTPTKSDGTEPMTTSGTYGGSANGSQINAGTPGSQYLPTQATNEQGGVTKTNYNADTNGNPSGVARYKSDGSTLVSGVTMEYRPLTSSDPNDPAASGGMPGQLKAIVDGRGKRTSYGYDGKGNINWIDPPGTGANQLGGTMILYDQNLARVSAVRDGNGKCRVLSYDNLDRLLKIEFRGTCSPWADSGTLDTHEPKVEYTYDRDGNQTTEITREQVAPGGTGTSRTRTMTYDKLNRVTLESLPGGASNTYTYDLVGNLRTLTDGGGKVEYTYDAVNQQRAVYEPGTNTPTTFKHNKDGLRESTTYPNGVAIDWKYDHANRIEKIHSKGPGGTTTLQNLEYRYRQPTSPNRQTPLRYEALDTVLNRRTRYEYDGLDRLVDATTKTATGTDTDSGWAGSTPIARYEYALDGAGNVGRRALSGSGVTADYRLFAYDEANQLCWRSPASELSTATTPPSTACTTGRQTAFDGNGNETTGANGTNRNAAYHLTDQTKTFTIGASPTTLVYLGAGQDRWVAEGTGNFQHNVLGAGSRAVGTSTDYFTRDEGGTLVSRRNASTRHFYLFDALGSITGLVNGDSTGAVAARYDYEPYGGRDTSATTAAASADVPTGQFGFAGGYRSVGGMYHYGQRFYDPLIMRWTQADPLDQTGDLREGNRYLYAAADPVGLVDPDGASTRAGGGAPGVGGASGGFAGSQGARTGGGGYAGTQPSRYARARASIGAYVDATRSYGVANSLRAEWRVVKTHPNTPKILDTMVEIYKQYRGPTP